MIHILQSINFKTCETMQNLTILSIACWRFSLGGRTYEKSWKTGSLHRKQRPQRQIIAEETANETTIR